MKRRNIPKSERVGLFVRVTPEAKELIDAADGTNWVVIEDLARQHLVEYESRVLEAEARRAEADADRLRRNIDEMREEEAALRETAESKRNSAQASAKVETDPEELRADLDMLLDLVDGTADDKPRMHAKVYPAPSIVEKHGLLRDEFNTALRERAVETDRDIGPLVFRAGGEQSLRRRYPDRPSAADISVEEMDDYPAWSENR